MRWHWESCTTLNSWCVSFLLCCLLQVMFDSMIRGEPDMVGLLLGSQELLCLSSRISRTLVSCYSLSELYLTGESVICPLQGESVDWWSNTMLSSTRHVVVTWQGFDTPRCCHLLSKVIRRQFFTFTVTTPDHLILPHTGEERAVHLIAVVT
jgi:hypothetical protein